ncbi:MAG: hypothetical protein KDD04_06665, partial [Sinomicrobium sp.]|nr:hypothetical protein [Sinomicrobium sp.]
NRLFLLKGQQPIYTAVILDGKQLRCSDEVQKEILLLRHSAVSSAYSLWHLPERMAKGPFEFHHWLGVEPDLSVSKTGGKMFLVLRS